MKSRPKKRSKKRSNKRSKKRHHVEQHSRGQMGYQWKVLENKPISDDEEDSEIRNMKKKSKDEGEKIFTRLVIEYVCKGKKWEDLQKVFRPIGSMSPWTVETAKYLGLESDTNYSLELKSPPSSPPSSPLSDPVKGAMKKKKQKKTRRKSKSKRR